MNTLFDDYEAFAEKFKVKKTTDDCYTPENVYEVVKSYALKLFPDWEGRPIARPFYHGASVPITFVTNHPSELRLLTAPDLNAKIAELNKANSNKKALTVRRFDVHATSIALLKKYGKIDFFIRKEECIQIKRLQMNKSALFGGGFLVADQVVRRIKLQEMKLQEMKLQEMKLQEMKLQEMKTLPLSCAEQEIVRRLTANCARRKSKEPGHEGDIIF